MSLENNVPDDLASAASLLRLTVREADHFAKHLLNEHELSFYLDAGHTTLRDVLSFVHKQSRFPGVSDDPLKITYHCSNDLSFSAYVVPTAAFEIAIHVSVGTVWALQDIILRAFSSQNFFNAQIGDIEYPQRWRGCECRAPLDTWPPRVRYWDYAAPAYAPNPMLFRLWRDKGVPAPPADIAPWIGRFTKKLPFDNERLCLSALMLEVALVWIAIHEEAHFRQGHLPYRIARVQSGNHEPCSPEMLQAYEFQADKDATQAVAELFFRAEIQKLLPCYASGDPCWLLRFLADAIGMVIIVMDVGRRCEGYASSHPPPHVRFLATLRHLFHFAKLRRINDMQDAFTNDAFYDGSPEDTELRSFHAQGGALWDMTQLQQLLNAEEAALIISDPMWPLDDAFPFVANPVLHFGASTFRDSPQMWAAVSKSARDMAVIAAAEFQIPAEVAQRHAEVAQHWVDETNALIERSNSRFRERTSAFRLWEDS